jgi:hypothetical protein
MLLRNIKSLVLPSSSVHKLGTYLAVALIVPGGSVIAFFMWALRDRGWLTGHSWRTLVGMAALGIGLLFPG